MVMVEVKCEEVPGWRWSTILGRGRGRARVRSEHGILGGLIEGQNLEGFHVYLVLPRRCDL
jgi:hypothetical protein